MQQALKSELRGGPSVVLHVGTMKSGTSYLQAVLRRNAKSLATVGVLVPKNMGPAVANILERSGSTKKSKVKGGWQRFLDSVESWDGPLVVASHEFLGNATPDEARAVIDTLQGRPVRIVITCRDLLRVIPSHWQTTIKNGGTVPFPSYVQLLLAEDEDAGEDAHRYATGFWRNHDLPELVRSWAGAVGLENVVLVTIPPPGSSLDLLWHRFADAAGLPPFDCDFKADAKSNVSLTYAETEMLRSVNMSVRRTMSQTEYQQIVNKYLANRLLRRAPDSERSIDRPIFGRESHQRVRRRADELVDALSDLPVEVVGSLEELRVAPYQGAPDGGDSRGPLDPIPEPVADTIANLLGRLARTERELAVLRGESVKRRRQRRKGKLTKTLDDDLPPDS